ncbi:MAG: hypothetical protein ACQEWV_25920 [Bacillota bacterium]
MNKETVRKIENNIIGVIIAVVIAYVICVFMFDLEVPGGILSPIFN